MIIIVEPGPLALIEDLGRPGHAHLGVSESGAADRAALRLANRLVGNPESAAAIEILLGGCTIEATHTIWVAVTGAATQLRINERPTSSHTTISLQAGDRLRIDAPREGLRNYLAVRGGIETPEVLGSRSTDLLAGLGPAQLESGDRLHLGSSSMDLPGIDIAPQPATVSELELIPGPRLDWFADDALALLLDSDWTVTSDSNRIAARLSGPVLTRTRTEELPSEGLTRGAIQVPASGLPLIFLSDHPVTGGYPVIAVLTDRATDQAAQLAPGASFRFTGAPRRN